MKAEERETLDTEIAEMVQSSSNGGGGGDVNQQQQPQQPWTQQQQQQQYPWGMAAQYPMMMQQQQQHQQMMLMYPQYAHHPYMAPTTPYATHPFHQPAHYAHAAAHSGTRSQIKTSVSPEDNRTLWVGDLHPWMDESYLYSCFAASGQVSSVKIIRNKQTGQSEGYGFVEHFSHEAAETVLHSYNGSVMPSSDQPFRLNWATFGGGASERKNNNDGAAGSDMSIFVGDLAADVTDGLLQETFASKYPSVKGAKVVMDQNTGRSKGYGFVRFGDEDERVKAMSEMNGVYCSSRPMRIGAATPKKLLAANGNNQQQHYYSSQALTLAGGGYAANGSRISQPANDTTNTTIFVGGIDSDTTDEDLRQAFSQSGEVVNVKIPFGKGCGFVQFANRSDAEDALEKLNGTVIGKHTIRLSWGRSVGNRQLRMETSNYQ